MRLCLAGEIIKIKPKVEDRIIKKKKGGVRNREREGREGRRNRDGEKHGAVQ